MFALKLCTKNKEAREKFLRFVDDFISNGAESFSDLTQADQCEIVGHFINALDDKTEWLVESKHADTTLSYITKILTFDVNHEWNRTDLIDSLQTQATTFYANILDEFMIELAREYRISRRKGE